MTKNEVRFLETEDYKVWINDIKKKIKQSQIKASVKVNYELLSLYWDLGRDIVEKQENAKWGDSFLAFMSKDLKREFPDMAGFSAQNLKHIRYWYRFYSHGEKGLQLVTQFEIVEKMIKSIPWGIIKELHISVKILMKRYFMYKKHWIIIGAEMS